ncbi:hypothetical protein D9M68_811750 [compost metagenome]
MLLAHAAGRDRRGPVGDPGHADAAFGQVHLAAHQRPVVGEALAAVVAGEDDQRVVFQSVLAQRGHQLADAFVHVVDHAAVGLHVAAVQVEQVLRHVGGHVSVVARLPGPVRRGVVQAEQKGLAGFRIGRALVNVIDRALREHVGEVAHFVVFVFVDVEVVFAAGRAVGEVVHAAGHDAEERVVA